MSSRTQDIEAEEALAQSRERERAHVLGRFVVVDPAICHGKPTVRGTRILVADILEEVAMGLAWETIEENWGAGCHARRLPKW